MQNSGLVNFVPESHLPFVQTETGIKDGFEEMEHEFLLGIFHPEKQDYLFISSIASRNFLLERPKKSCSIYFPTRFSGNFL